MFRSTLVNYTQPIDDSSNARQTYIIIIVKLKQIFLSMCAFGD